MILGVIFPYLVLPLAACSSVLVWLRLWPKPDDRRVIAALDRLLEEQSAAMRRERRENPLRFRTAERVRLPGLGFGLGVRTGSADVVRIIRAATPRGYRLRVRAFARVVGGRTVVRSIDVDVPRR